MKVLITGAPGWLGNRFLDVLVRGYQGEGGARNWDLRCLTLKGMNLSFIRELAKSRSIECVEGDVRQAESLDAAMKGVDTVFHIAGIIHPQRIADLYAINADGTRNVLAAAIRQRVKRIVFTSSNSVAGTNLSRAVLMTEDDPPRPYLNYGKSKWLAEEAIKAAQRKGDIETVILRPCWYYGPNQPDRQTTFFRMIQKGNPIVFGDGRNLRSMSYVDNSCQALILAAESPKAVGQTYWIADGEPYSTLQIYETVAELLDVKNFKPRFVPGIVSECCLTADRMLQGMGLYIKEIHVAGEMNKDIACSIDKARRELGYHPQINLREGMKRSIEWCRKNGQLA